MLEPVSSAQKPVISNQPIPIQSLTEKEEKEKRDRAKLLDAFSMLAIFMQVMAGIFSIPILVSIFWSIVFDLKREFILYALISIFPMAFFYVLGNVISSVGKALAKIAWD